MPVRPGPASGSPKISAALDVLCSRPEVDPRVGCGGLSGGGLRTCYLAGLDDRIACAVPVGMMTTWRDYLLNKSYVHTWMIYIPHLRDLDYPEILGLRVPRPVLLLNDTEDRLFTLSEMRRRCHVAHHLRQRRRQRPLPVQLLSRPPQV